MDRSVDPCADLYQYSCGGWQKSNPIPPDQTSWSVYQKMYEDNLAFLRAILEQAVLGKDRDAVTQKIGDYYAACMDEAGVEKRGAAPLKADLDAIAAAKSAREISPLLVRLQRESVDRGILFGVGSQQDPDDSENQIASFDQGGLGLRIATTTSGRTRSRRTIARNTRRISRKCSNCSAMRPNRPKRARPKSRALRLRSRERR
jgi:putative endopeptidase